MHNIYLLIEADDGCFPVWFTIIFNNLKRNVHTIKKYVIYIDNPRIFNRITDLLL